MSELLFLVNKTWSTASDNRQSRQDNDFMGTGGRVTAVALNGLVIRAILSSSLFHETHTIHNNLRYKILQEVSSVGRQWKSKHSMTSLTLLLTTIEELLDTVFSVEFYPKLHSEWPSTVLSQGFS